ncbi:MAG TPA: hypothetical protein VHN79_14015 [Lacunisphaera sp.]|nr:hypothetical protein [Lacunisphaera sp.]
MKMATGVFITRFQRLQWPGRVASGETAAVAPSGDGMSRRRLGGRMGLRRHPPDLR